MRVVFGIRNRHRQPRLTQRAGPRLARLVVASAEAVGASRMAAKEGQFRIAISREKGTFRHIFPQIHQKTCI
jgi:hypothetical protein